MTMPSTPVEQARAVAELLYGRWADQYPDATVTICTQGTRVVGSSTAEPKRKTGSATLSTGETVDVHYGGRERQKLGGKLFGGAGTAPIADIDTLVRAAHAHLADETLSGFCSINIQTKPVTDGRGTDDVHDGFTALYLDIDIRRDTDDIETMPSGHRVKVKPLPTRDEARTLINRVAEVLGGGKRFHPAIVMESSDEGLYAIWPLEELAAPHDDKDPNNIAHRWNTLTQSIADELGVHLDSVSKDMARVLRLPGQRRLKGSARSLVAVTDRQYDELMTRIEHGDAEAKAEYDRLAARPVMCEPSIARLLAWRPDRILTGQELERLPIVEKKATTKTATAVTTTKPTKPTGDYKPTGADMAVDEISPLALAAVLWDIDVLDDDRFHWCNGSSPTSGQEVGGELFINSETMRTDLGVGGVLSSTSMLRWMTGDNKLARQVINALGDLPTVEERLDWVAAVVPEPYDGDDLDDWRTDIEHRLAEVHELEPDRVVEAHLDNETTIAATITSDEDRLLALIQQPTRDQNVFTVTSAGLVRAGARQGSWRLVLGGADHGTYRLSTKVVKDDDGVEREEEVLTKLSNAVIIRTAQHRLLRVLTDDEPVTFDAVVVTPIGRAVVRDLTPEQSLDVSKVLALANVGGTAPDWTGARELRNCVANTAVASQEVRLSFARAGWSDADGVLRYVTATNSYDPNGVNSAVRVEGDDADALTALSAEMPTADDFKRLPEMLESAFALVPGAPVIAAALTMQAVSAPIRVTGPNATLWLTGKTGSGKTRLAFLSSMWSQGGSGTPWEVPVVDMKKTTAKGPSQAAMLHGDVASLFDDIRIGGVDGEHSIRDQMRMARDVIGLAHDRRGRAVAGRDQRLRSGGQCDASAIITSEVVFPGSEHSMTAKMIVLPEVKQELVDFSIVEQLDIDGNPVRGLDDRVLQRYRTNAHYSRYAAMANRVFTGWIAYLHADCIRRANGNVRRWAALNEEARQDIAALLSNGRTQQVVARLIAGWTMFRDYVRSHGVELPDWTQYADEMLSSATEAVAQQTEEAALIAALIGALDTQRGHLASGRGTAPRSSMAARVGWADRGGQSLSPSGPLLGWLSDDGHWVVMSSAHAQHLQPHSTQQALARTLTSLVPEEDQHLYAQGAPRQSRRGFGEPLRGWKIAAARLGLDTAEDADDADEVSDEF